MIWFIAGCSLVLSGVVSLVARNVGYAKGLDDGRKLATRSIRKDAIEAGVGKWCINEFTGEAYFEFIEQGEAAK